ncbi:hypothetical protein GCM10009605_26230 [Nocardiopsis composta]
MLWAVATAIVGALAAAAGAAFQERALTSAPFTGVGQLQLIRAMARRPLWVTGTALTFAGVGAHLWALGHAPLVVIQPIGISGLLFAVMLSAFFKKRRLSTAQVLGALAVTAALAGLLSTIPPSEGPPPGFSKLIVIGLAGAGAMLACTLVGRTRNSTARACALALGGGIGYAAASAFGRVIGSAAVNDLTAALHPLTALAVAIGLAGGLLTQNAYRAGHFALAYAIVLISDPIAATLIGVLCFGERLPTDPVNGTIALVAAVVGAAGVVVLARSSRQDPMVQAAEPSTADRLATSR